MSQTPLPPQRPFLLILACLIAISGCGDGRPQTFPARGRVVFADGQPVRSGTIELESRTHGVTASGRIESDGTFVLGTFSRDDGAVAGEHRAIVVQLIISDGLTRHAQNHGRAVNPRYGSFDQSGLTVTIPEGGDSEIVVTLQPTP